MVIQADEFGTVVRLYDGINDNPNELNLVAYPDDRIGINICDRDEGNTELSIVVTRSELLAALMVLQVDKVHVSEN